MGFPSAPAGQTTKTFSNDSDPWFFLCSPQQCDLVLLAVAVAVAVACGVVVCVVVVLWRCGVSIQNPRVSFAFFFHFSIFNYLFLYVFFFCIFSSFTFMFSCFPCFSIVAFRFGEGTVCFPPAQAACNGSWHHDTLKFGDMEKEGTAQGEMEEAQGLPGALLLPFLHFSIQPPYNGELSIRTPLS